MRNLYKESLHKLHCINKNDVSNDVTLTLDLLSKVWFRHVHPCTLLLFIFYHGPNKNSTCRPSPSLICGKICKICENIKNKANYNAAMIYNVFHHGSDSRPTTKHRTRIRYLLILWTELKSPCKWIYWFMSTNLQSGILTSEY